MPYALSDLNNQPYSFFFVVSFITLSLWAFLIELLGKKKIVLTNDMKHKESTNIIVAL